jgi:pyochelin synthetase
MDGIDRDGYVTYLRCLDEVALLCMLEAFRSKGLFTRPGGLHSLDEILARMQAVPRRHRTVRRWLRALHGNGFLSRDRATGDYAGDAPVDATTIAAAWRRVDAMLASFDPASQKVHDYFKASTSCLPELLSSEGADAVQLLFPEGRLDVSDSLYNVTLFNRWANQILAASTRRIAAAETWSGPLRVLEVGAGVGGTSKDVIPALADYDVDYLFTDLSQFFLNSARATFGDFPWVRYATLDVNRDYRAQGFSPNAFDVVILGDVLHATRHVGRSVAALRELLAPNGWLLFAEMTRDHYQIMTSMELLLPDDISTGDFEDMRHGRDQTFVAHSDWLQLLAQPGDELAFALPHDDDVLSEIGLRVYASRVKTDRAGLKPQQVIDTVAERLPPAMVPSLIQVVDQLPVTPNAKVDRERLGSLVPPSRETLTACADRPADDLERRIAELWAEVLALPRVGRAQGFFDVGGDSLLASQLTGYLLEKLPEVKTMKFNVLLRLLLEGPTVMTLAAQLREAP